jgi:hypothetical protein
MHVAFYLEILKKEYNSACPADQLILRNAVWNCELDSADS